MRCRRSRGGVLGGAALRRVVTSVFSKNVLLTLVCGGGLLQPSVPMVDVRSCARSDSSNSSARANASRGSTVGSLGAEEEAAGVGVCELGEGMMITDPGPRDLTCEQ